MRDRLRNLQYKNQNKFPNILHSFVIMLLNILVRCCPGEMGACDILGNKTCPVLKLPAFKDAVAVGGDTESRGYTG